MSGRLLTYNICVGGRGREALLATVIAAAAPDRVVLNEADDEEVVAGLAERLAMQVVWAHSRDGRPRNALLTRWPVLAARSLHPRPLTRPVLAVRVAPAPGHSLTIFGVHLMP